MNRHGKILRALDVLSFVFLCFLFVSGARTLFIQDGPLTSGVLLVAAVGLYLLADYTVLQFRRWQHTRGRHKCEHERALQEALYLLECHVDTDLGQCRVDLFGECSAHWPRDAFGNCAHPQAVALLNRYPVEATPDVRFDAPPERPAPVGPGGEGSEAPARGAGQAEAETAGAVERKIVRWSGTLGMVERLSVDGPTLARPEMFVAYRDTPLPLTVRGSDGQAHIGGTILGLGLLNQHVVAHGVLRVDYLTEHAPELLELLLRGEDAPVGLEVTAVDGDYTYGDDASLTFHTWTIRGAMLGVDRAAWPEAQIRLDAEEIRA